MNLKEKKEFIKTHIGSYPDFPKPGILFRDVFSLLKDPKAFCVLKDVLVTMAKDIKPPVEAVVGIDSRGFLFGPLVALELKIPFVPIRKKGKLPGEVNSKTYKLEYGEDTLQIQKNSIRSGTRVLIVDDLIATGGSMVASYELVKELGATPCACLVVMELEDLKGRQKLPCEVHSIVQY